MINLVLARTHQDVMKLVGLTVYVTEFYGLRSKWLLKITILMN